MEEKYCDYTNSKWINKFEGLKNGKLTTRIEGNTIYIEEFLEPHNEVEYIKYIFGLYRKKEKRVAGKRVKVAFLVMCKCHEKTLIEWLESYGFVI